MSSVRQKPRPLFLPLLGLVCFVCREEGHAVGPEVSVEVRGLVETPAAHLAAQVAIAVLAQRLRGGGRREAGGVVSARGAPFGVAVGVPHAVGDEAVPAEGTGRREADAALQALEGGGVGPVLRDVALKLCPVLRGEAARDAPENVVFFLLVVGRRRRGYSGSSCPLCRACAVLAIQRGVFFLLPSPSCRRTALAVMFRGASRSFPTCGCTFPGHGGTLKNTFIQVIKH